MLARRRCDAMFDFALDDRPCVIEVPNATPGRLLSARQPNNDGKRRRNGVVDEHVVASSQRIPLELQHHPARSSAPSKTWSHGLQSHHSGVGVGSRVGSPGNIWRQRQHRRSGTPIDGPSGPTGRTDGTGCPSSWPSWRRSRSSATGRSRCWFGGTSLGMAPLSSGRCAARYCAAGQSSSYVRLEITGKGFLEKSS